MFPSIDELMKAQAEAFKTTNSVATTAFDGARKLLELNVQAARAGMEESSAQLKALLAARDVSALNTLLADLFSQFSRPEGNKAAAYVKDVYDIAQQTHSQVAELIEKQVASSQQQLLAAVDALAKNAPAGSEGAVKLLIRTEGLGHLQAKRAIRLRTDDAAPEDVDTTRSGLTIRSIGHDRQTDMIFIARDGCLRHLLGGVGLLPAVIRKLLDDSKGREEDEEGSQCYHHLTTHCETCASTWYGGAGGGALLIESLHLIGPVSRSDILARGLDAVGSRGLLAHIAREPSLDGKRVQDELEGLYLTREGRLEVDLEDLNRRVVR